MATAAAPGAMLPAARASSASVASSAARENRVGGRNSRTSSQPRAWPISLRRAETVASSNEAASIAVQTAARAAASRLVSPAATASSARRSPARATRSSAGRAASAVSTALDAVSTAAGGSLRLRQHERRLGFDESGAEPVRLDRRWGRRRGLSRGDEREACPHQGGESGDVAHRYCAIFTLRRAAAWVTWPATATACS